MLGNAFAQIYVQIVSTGVKTLSKTYLVASTHIKREKAWLAVDARGSKMPLQKLPNNYVF